MRRLLAPAAILAVLLMPTPAFAAENVDIRLQDVNHTGARGTASITMDDAGNLTVVITASGLAPNLPHPQHLHGAMSGMDTHCPSPATDKNNNGYVSVEEGVPMYGDVFLSLTTTGDTSFTSALAINRMPVADAHGNLNYRRTIAAADLPANTAAHLKDLHVVEHGIDANHNGQYDLAGLGESTFARSLGVPNIPEEETEPATCGLPAAAAAAAVPTGGVATGDGSDPVQPQTIYLIGGVAIGFVLIVTIARRRRRLGGLVALLLLAGCASAPPSPAAAPDRPVQKSTQDMALRSEERRVGKECRSRWSPYH